MPGVDVTSVFANAAKDMPSDALVFAHDFTLQDAMAAFQIGEPRFDSGLALLDPARPVFDPLARLLPEEVCWIIDRAFACEMEWHLGYSLSQTIFSCLYVHAIHEIDPESIAAHPAYDHALISLVLRASVCGLLKTCDLAWRELNKGNLYDTEDWQSDKCDVSLCEALPVPHVQAQLDRACDWVVRSCKAPQPWKDALWDRLILRKTLLGLFAAQLSKDYFRFRPLIHTARQSVQRLRQTLIPEPDSQSPALRAFDPQFARVLVSFIPLHVIRLPDQDTVWNKLLDLLDSFEQFSILVAVHHLATWKIIGHFQAWSSYRSLPYIRSASQSALFEDGRVLSKHTQKHVVNCFFNESCGWSFDAFVDAISRRWKGPRTSPLAHLERLIIELELGYTKALWYNPARRRRYCMKSLFDWHTLYALLLDIQLHLEPSHEPDPLPRLCTAILFHRLSVICEVVYSGAQLSLYSAEERVLAYWYATQVIELQLSCLDALIPVMPGTPAGDEHRYQSVLLTALQALSCAVFSVTLKHLGPSWQRLQLNARRRYKWAFSDEYADVARPPVGHVHFRQFVAACAAVQQDRDASPAGQVQLARVLLGTLDGFTGGWTGPFGEARQAWVRGLSAVCVGLETLPASMAEVETWAGVLRWDVDVHPWFPVVA